PRPTSSEVHMIFAYCPRSAAPGGEQNLGGWLDSRQVVGNREACGKRLRAAIPAGDFLVELANLSHDSRPEIALADYLASHLASDATHDWVGKQKFEHRRQIPDISPAESETRPIKDLDIFRYVAGKYAQASSQGVEQRQRKALQVRRK